jgi:hypothetical protein
MTKPADPLAELRTAAAANVPMLRALAALLGLCPRCGHDYRGAGWSQCPQCDPAF